MLPIDSAGLSSQSRTIRAFIAAGLLLGLAILFLAPSAGLPLPRCTFHAITGHSCLTCGMTRSLHAASHGDLAASVRHHLFGPAVIFGMLLYFVIFSMEAIRGKNMKLRASRRIRNRVFMLLGMSWIVYWGARIIVECCAA